MTVGSIGAQPEAAVPGCPCCRLRARRSPSSCESQPQSTPLLWGQTRRVQVLAPHFIAE